MLPNFEYARATSVRDAIEQCLTEGAVYHAGGTDLLGCLRGGVFSARKVVALSSLDALRGIERSANGGLRIGALTTLAEIAKSPVIREEYTALSDAAASAASPQLRNQGTIGGNLCQRPRCWYFRGDFDCLRRGGSFCSAMADGNQYHCILGGYGCYMVHPSDTAPALLALDASVRIASRTGSRLLSIESFFVSPSENIRSENVLREGEILTEVILPQSQEGLRSTYRKVRSRRSWDFALAGVAVAMAGTSGRVEQPRIVLSGVAPIPWRSSAAEQAIQGESLNTASIVRAAEASVSGARPLSRNGYKVDLVRGLVAETLTVFAVH